MRRVFNWSFDDVDRFLRDNNFIQHYVKGSHFYYRGYVNKELKIVCVPFHGSRSIKPRTIKGIIKQSGISKEKWLLNK